MSENLGVSIGVQVPRKGNVFTRWLGRFFMWLFGGWTVKGEIPNEPKFIAAAGPHTSYWDFAVTMPLVLAMGLKISYLAKHTLFIPPFHIFFEWLGGIPINRTNPQGMIAEMTRAFAEREQMILALAPEGTRSKVPSLKAGFLNISKATGVPILLIGIDFDNKVMEFGPVLRPSGDMEADKKIASDYFSSMGAKRPELV
jgi:1-acyl-sn-glycerol-3-phosphate acyltransferase